MIRASSKITPRETLLGVGAVTNFPAVAYVIFYVIFVAFVLGAQSITTSRQPPAQVDNPHASASSTVPLTPPMSYSR